MTAFERFQIAFALIGVGALFPLLSGSPACAATPPPPQAVAALPDDSRMTYDCANARREVRHYGSATISFAICSGRLLITIAERGQVLRGLMSQPIAALPQSGPLSAILSSKRAERTLLTLTDGSTLSIPPSVGIADAAPVFGAAQ